MIVKTKVSIDFTTEQVVDALLDLLTDAERARVADLGTPVLHFPLTHLVDYESSTFSRPYRVGDTYGDGLCPVGLSWSA